MSEAQKARGNLHVHPRHTSIRHRGEGADDDNAQWFQSIYAPVPPDWYRTHGFIDYKIPFERANRISCNIVVKSRSDLRFRKRM